MYMPLRIRIKSKTYTWDQTVTTLVSLSIGGEAGSFLLPALTSTQAPSPFHSLWKLPPKQGLHCLPCNVSSLLCKTSALYLTPWEAHSSILPIPEDTLALYTLFIYRILVSDFCLMVAASRFLCQN